MTLPDASIIKLKQVHPALAAVVNRAAELSTQPFVVVQGLRTQAEAQANLAKGTSRTTNSLHLRQPDGYAHAVDLAALIDGKVAFEPLSSFYLMAGAMQCAAVALGVTVRWGGVWDEALNTLKPDLAGEQSAYTVRFGKANHRAPLADEGHFELPRGVPITYEAKT